MSEVRQNTIYICDICEKKVEHFKLPNEWTRFCLGYVNEKEEAKFYSGYWDVCPSCHGQQVWGHDYRGKKLLDIFRGMFLRRTPHPETK